MKDNGEVTLYTYEGWNVVAEETAAQDKLRTANREPQTTTRYTWGEDLSGSLQGAGGIGGLLSSTLEQSPTKNEAQRTTNCFHYDSNGNIILLTDAKAQETARYSYDAFGKTLTATGPAAQNNRYRFSTKPVEEESGLVYYGYRWYDPVTGRWPSRDPMGQPNFAMFCDVPLTPEFLAALRLRQGDLDVYLFAANAGTIRIDVHGLHGCEGGTHLACATCRWTAEKRPDFTENYTAGALYDHKFNGGPPAYVGWSQPCASGEFIWEMKLTEWGWGQFAGGETFSGDGSVLLPVQTRYALVWAAATAINDAKAKFCCCIATSQN